MRVKEGGVVGRCFKTCILFSHYPTLILLVINCFPQVGRVWLVVVIDQPFGIFSLFSVQLRGGVAGQLWWVPGVQPGSNPNRRIHMSILQISNANLKDFSEMCLQKLENSVLAPLLSGRLSE